MFGAVELHAVICGNAINQQKVNKKRVLFHVKHKAMLYDSAPLKRELAVRSTD